MSELFRVSFNFTSKCNLACKFCYIPFERHETSFEESREVVARIFSLGAKSITFGGGDPLKYKFILELINFSRGLGFEFIQIDTNALGWASRKDLREVAELVDVIGLPLDGSTPEIHELMRSNSHNWSDSVSAAIFLRETGRVKINTVASRKNASNIFDLFALIEILNPKIWSIYEFWPIGKTANENKSEFMLKNGEYDEIITSIGAISVDASFRIEFGAIQERSNSYFLVSDQGESYCVNQTLSDQYIKLGSVFDDDILDRWSAYSDPSKNLIRTKERINFLKSF